MRSFIPPQVPAAFSQFGACIISETASTALVKWAKQNTAANHVASYSVDGQQHWIDLTLTVWDDQRIHFHVEINRGKIPKIERERRRSLKELVKVITGFIDKSDGNEDFGVLQAKVPVRISDLPQHGAIVRALGFNRNVAGSQLSLIAGSLDISNDEFFDRINFRLSKDKDEVLVNLWAFSEIQMNYGYLDQCRQLLEIGVATFVFESISREATNARP